MNDHKCPSWIIVLRFRLIILSTKLNIFFHTYNDKNAIEYTSLRHILILTDIKKEKKKQKQRNKLQHKYYYNTTIIIKRAQFRAGQLHKTRGSVGEFRFVLPEGNFVLMEGWIEYSPHRRHVVFIHGVYTLNEL